MSQEWYIPAPTIDIISPPEVNVIQDAAALGIGSLKGAIESAASVHNLSKYEVIVKLRELSAPGEIAEIRDRYLDRTMYFGCWHGGDSESTKELWRLANGPEENLPDTIIFGGDLPGAENQGTIKQKQLFYDGLMNHSGAILSKEWSDPKDALDTHIDPNNLESATFRDGVTNLLNFAVEDMGKRFYADDLIPQKSLELAIVQMKSHPYEGMPEIHTDNPDQILFEYIKWIKKQGLNSGTWVGTLPKNIRQEYMNQYQATATDFLLPLWSLKKQGVNIIWVEGNEDMAESLKAISEGLDSVFDTQKYLEDNGITCEKTITGVRGKASYHLLVPFNELKHMEDIPPEKLEKLQAEVELARSEGVEIIMVTHMQLDHGRHFNGQEPKGEQATMISNLKQLLRMFKPRELMYPHQHWDMPNIPDPNAKYIFEETGTIVSHIPLLHHGELTIPVLDKIRRARKGILFEAGTRPIKRVPRQVQDGLKA